MPRIPLLTGTRLAIVNVSGEDVVLRPPPPGGAIRDVAAAVRDALRFPLTGERLEGLVPRAGRATIVVELARVGVPLDRQTIVVAGGLQRRLGHRDLETLVEPEFARRFRGRVEVHDVEDPDLVPIGEVDGTPLRLNRRLVETDAVVLVTAAETLLHGGPAALLAAGGPEALRAARTASLVDSAGSAGWKMSVALERMLAARVPVMGV